MGMTLGILAIVGAVVIVGCLIALTNSRKSTPGSGSTPATATSTPTAAPASTSTSTSLFETVKKYWLWEVGVVVVLLLVAFAFRDEVKKLLTLSPLVIASVIVGAGALYGLKGAGGGAKYFTWLVAGGAVFVLFTYVIFGERAPEVAQKMRESAVNLVLDDTPKPVVTIPGPDATVGPVIFKEGEKTTYASFEKKERRIFIPLHTCVQYSPSEKFRVVESTSTFITLQPLEPVVATFKAHPQGRPPCPPL